MSNLLQWDRAGERFYETGIKDCGLYPFTNGEYKPGVAWNGITGVTESPSGADENALYADDIKYLSLRSAEEFGATIEAYMYPDEFMACDGSIEAIPGVVVGQQSRQKFGLAYKTTVGSDADGDKAGYKLHLVYGCTASVSERSYQTVNDSPEAITFSWEISTVPVAISNEKMAKNTTSLLTLDSRKIDVEALKILEQVLKGLSADDPANKTGKELPARLPLPDEVIDILEKKADPLNKAA